jgi:uncharacterized protein
MSKAVAILLSLSLVFLLLSENASANEKLEKINSQATEALNKGELRKALMLFSEAGMQGYAISQYNVGTLYLQHANGNHEHLDIGQTWVMKAAQQDFPAAVHKIGDLFRTGLSSNKGLILKQDMDEAFLWYRRGAELGFPLSQNNMGYFYLQGISVPKNEAKAFYWYLKAAEQDVVGAQFQTGVMYANGVGVNKNMLEAKKWVGKVKDKGIPQAQQKWDELELSKY